MTTAAQISELYEGILRRAPTTAEVDAWLKSSGTFGTTPDEIADQLIASSETDAFVAPVVRLYQAAFGRLPDAAGLDGWVSALRAGTLTLREIATGFVKSEEFAVRFHLESDPRPDIPTRFSLVTQLYENTLQRTPDAESLNKWVYSRKTLADVLLGFSESAEFKTLFQPKLQDILDDAVGGQDPFEEPQQPNEPPPGPPPPPPPPGNKPPVAFDGTLVVDEDSDPALLVLSPPADPDPDDALTVTITGLPDPNKGFILRGETPVAIGDTMSVGTLAGLRFCPISDANGEAGSFSYSVSDGKDSASASVAITINAVNDGVTAEDDEYTVLESTPLEVGPRGILANDDAPDGDLRAVPSSDSSPYSTERGGYLTLHEDGSFTYVPPERFTGTDSVEVIVNDGDGSTATSRITFHVEPRGGGGNSPPETGGDQTLTLDEDAPATPLDIIPPSDPDGDVLDVYLVALPDPDQAVILLDGNEISSTEPILTVEELSRLSVLLAPDYAGPDFTFRYTVTDGAIYTSGSVTISVNPQDDPVYAHKASYAVTGAQDHVSAQLGLASISYAPDGGLRFSTGEFTTEKGNLVVISEDGSFTFINDSDYEGEDSFTYTAFDADGDQESAVVTLSVSADSGTFGGGGDPGMMRRALISAPDWYV